MNYIDFVNGLVNFRKFRSFLTCIQSWTLLSFPHPDIGRKLRKEDAHLYKATTDRNWTPVLEVTRQFQVNKKSQVQIL